MKIEPKPSDREVLAGLVERVTYQNADSGFCVVRVRVRGRRELVTLVGHIDRSICSSVIALTPPDAQLENLEGTTMSPACSKLPAGSCAPWQLPLDRRAGSLGARPL